MNFKKYKRIFAFGCSFTRYSWPTWADLISNESDAEFYNYGFSGMGNLGISIRITEANKRYKFNEDDLILVMWSTFCREDRWVKGGWMTRGSVYNSYSEDFLKNYADTMGYLIRDHGVISMATSFIKSLKCDSLILRSTPFEHTEVDMEITYLRQSHLIKKWYLEEYNSLPKSLYEYFGNKWDSGEPVEYLENWASDISEHHMVIDSHPQSSVYANYLESIGIKLSEETHKLAKDSDILLKKSKTKLDLVKHFKWIDPANRPYFLQLT